MMRIERPMDFKKVAIVPGYHLSFLDHIIPLCDLFEMPLYCPQLWDIVETFYPPIKKTKDFTPFETLFYVEPYRLHDSAFQFGNQLFPEKRKSVCGLHGNSNKYRETFWAERFVEEDVVLLYGPYMQQFFEEKGVWNRLKKAIFCGNYRLNYYRKYRNFFKIKLPGEGKKILYAPTWSFADGTDNSPFFEKYAPLLDNVPKGFTLFVKLHPYTYHLYPKEVQKIKKDYQNHKRVFFLENTPLVYPILEEIDIYIGDYSSVGYDFLAFNRPLFFLGRQKDPLLLECGHEIEENRDFFSQLEERGSEEKREQLYQRCFIDVCEEDFKCAVLESL